MSIGDLQAAFDALEAELRQVQQEQTDTPSGTPEWWQLQRQIAGIVQAKNSAEVALITAQLAATHPAHSSKITAMNNRLYFLRQEMTPLPPRPLSDKVRLYHPLDRRSRE